MFWLAALLAASLIEPPSRHLRVEDVRLGDRGGYRFLVDTGAESSTALPDAIRQARGRAHYAVEVVTPVGSFVAPAYSLPLAVGHHAATVEVLGYVPPLGADGVLGMNFLRSVGVTLDYRREEVRFEGVPEGAVLLPVRLEQGRWLAEATSSRGERLRLLLDSGASDLVLRRPGRADSRSRLCTVTGCRDVAAGMLRALCVGPLRFRKVPFAEGEVAPGVDGLLPLHLFGAVHLDGPTGRVYWLPR